MHLKQSSSLLYQGIGVSPSGKRRLIVVTPADRGSMRMPALFQPVHGLGLNVITFAVDSNGGEVTALNSVTVGLWMTGSAGNIDVFAGQSDPVDPSKFAIEIGGHGASFWIDGELNDDGQVEFQWRGKASPRAIEANPIDIIRRDGRKVQTIDVWRRGLFSPGRNRPGISGGFGAARSSNCSR